MRFEAEVAWQGDGNAVVRTLEEIDAEYRKGAPVPSELNEARQNLRDQLGIADQRTTEEPG